MLNKHKKPTCAQVCKSGCYIGGYKCVSLVKSTIIRDTKRVSPLYPSPRGRDMVRLEMSFANTGLFINVTSAGTNLDMHFCIRCEIMGGQWAPHQPMVVKKPFYKLPCSQPPVGVCLMYSSSPIYYWLVLTLQYIIIYTPLLFTLRVPRGGSQLTTGEMPNMVKWHVHIKATTFEQQRKTTMQCDTTQRWTINQMHNKCANMSTWINTTNKARYKSASQVKWKHGWATKGDTITTCAWWCLGMSIVWTWCSIYNTKRITAKTLARNKPKTQSGCQKCTSGKWYWAWV